MSVAIPAEEVGAKIVEWYSCIIARSVDQAVLLHAEIKQLIKRMEPSDRTLAYYSLVEFRFNMMYHQSTDEQEATTMLQKVTPTAEQSVDHMLRYLYYFVSGQNEFMNERYSSAIRLFRKAERLLEHVNDEAEEAEFHYYMGASLYRISQYPFSASYLEDALVSFNRLNYTERVISSKVMLAGIYSETAQHPRAIEMIEDALSDSQSYPLSKLIATRAFGLINMREKKYSEALTLFKVVLDSSQEDNILTAKTYFDLSNVLFKLNKTDEARYYYKKAKNGAEYYRNIEHKCKCLALEGLYIEPNQTIIDAAINQLYSNRLYFEIDEIAEETAHFFQNEGDLKSCVKYLKKAYQAKNSINSIGVAQE